MRKHRALQSFRARRRRKAEFGAIDVIGHRVVAIVGGHQVGQNVFAASGLGVTRIHVSNIHRDSRSIRDGERIQRPEADGRAHTDAQLRAFCAADVERNHAILR